MDVNVTFSFTPVASCGCPHALNQFVNVPRDPPAWLPSASFTQTPAHSSLGSMLQGSLLRMGCFIQWWEVNHCLYSSFFFFFKEQFNTQNKNTCTPRIQSERDDCTQQVFSRLESGALDSEKEGTGRLTENQVVAGGRLLFV